MNTTAAAPSRRWVRIAVVVVAWAALALSWVLYQRHTGLGTTATMQRLIDAAHGNWWAVVAFLMVSLLRPLVLFPATLVTVAAGMLFGPVLGVAVAAAGANASAMVSFQVGTTFTAAQRPDAVSAVARWATRLRENTFEAVLLMRLLFLPYDLVNYGCGVLRVRVLPFITATALGSLPGTVAFVLAGASIDDLSEGFGGIDGPTLIASVVLVVGGLIVSRLLRRRSAGRIEADNP